MTRELLTGADLGGPLVLATGTTTVAPVTFRSGTNLASATAGVMEYDGKVFYSTPVGRGVSPSMMCYRLNANNAGANSTGAQSIFGAAVTLTGSTVYAIESYFILQKTAGSSSHTIGFSFGGGATLNNTAYGILWSREATTGTSNAMSSFNPLFAFSTTGANLVLTGSIATTGQTFTARVSGTVSINAGGTFIPQYTLSAAPGGAYSTLAGSYFNIWPIGTSGSNTAVGPWA